MATAEQLEIRRAMTEAEAQPEPMPMIIRNESDEKALAIIVGLFVWGVFMFLMTLLFTHPSDTPVVNHQNCAVTKISETDENNHISTSCGDFKISDKLVSLISIGHRYDLQAQKDDVLNVTITSGK